MARYHPLSLLLGFLFCAAPTLSQTVSKDEPSVILSQNSATDHCDCYLVSGPDPGYFQHYQFWDFRQAPLPHQLTPSDHQAPGKGHNNDDDGEDSVFGSNALLLSRSSFAEDWNTQNWERTGTAQNPIRILNSAQNIFFATDPLGANGTGGTYLVLRTTRHEDHTTAAEFESRMKNVFHSSLRVRLRVLPYGRVANQSAQEDNHTLMGPGGPPKGACAGIFMYHSSDCETDIEILTSDPPNIVHYANQPDYDPATDTAIPGAGIVAAIPTPWTQWSTHRIDWLSNLSVWYVDDRLQSSKTYGVPDRPSVPVINLWSDGGEWSGDMSVGESVFLGIEWIQMAYNVSSVPAQGIEETDEADVSDKGKKKKGKGKGRKKDTGKKKEKNKECRRPCQIG